MMKNKEKEKRRKWKERMKRMNHFFENLIEKKLKKIVFFIKRIVFFF
jgi:hypothetical protein